MTDILRDLAGRIRSETQNVEHAAQLAGRRWRKALLDEDYLGSVALDLQSCYQGIERCFELVARVVDGSAPGGANGIRPCSRRWDRSCQACAPRSSRHTPKGSSISFAVSGM